MQSTNKIDMDILRDNIKREMSLANLNAHSLAQKANLNYTYVYNILQKKSKNPRLIYINNIANALNVSLEQLTQGKVSFLRNSIKESPEILKECDFYCIAGDDSFAPHFRKDDILIVKETQDVANKIAIVKTANYIGPLKMPSQIDHNQQKIFDDCEISNNDEMEILGKVIGVIKTV